MNEWILRGAYTVVTVSNYISLTAAAWRGELVILWQPQQRWFHHSPPESREPDAEPHTRGQSAVGNQWPGEPNQEADKHRHQPCPFVVSVFGRHATSGGCFPVPGFSHINHVDERGLLSPAAGHLRLSSAASAARFSHDRLWFLCSGDQGCGHDAFVWRWWRRDADKRTDVC